MLIKFVKPDPRAGTVARMDSHRGQELVDAGAAVKVKEDGSEATTQDSALEVKKESEPAGKPSDGLKVDELKAALEAKGIEIPEGAKKAELAALLDGAE